MPMATSWRRKGRGWGSNRTPTRSPDIAFSSSWPGLQGPFHRDDLAGDVGRAVCHQEADRASHLDRLAVADQRAIFDQALFVEHATGAKSWRQDRRGRDDVDADVEFAHLRRQ